VSAAAERQRESTAVREHRPWPLPRSPWKLAQTWRDLLFAHWPVEPERMRAVVPSALPLDLWEGRAWIAVTPFEVCGHHPRGLPPLPGLSRFPEVNVRTYVTVHGRPGIHFLSLDTTSLLAVLGARMLYRLPYFPARMRIDRQAGGVAYSHRRLLGPSAALTARYGPVGEVCLAQPGTFEHWLTERYCLFVAAARGRVRRADIHHPPWPLQPARAELAENSMGRQAGLALDGEPHLLFAARQDVVIWELQEEAGRR
jgi:uncharacterized protein YqjF (DUF2071 family)